MDRNDVAFVLLLGPLVILGWTLMIVNIWLLIAEARKAWGKK